MKNEKKIVAALIQVFDAHLPTNTGIKKQNIRFLIEDLAGASAETENEELAKVFSDVAKHFEEVPVLPALDEDPSFYAALAQVKLANRILALELKLRRLAKYVAQKEAEWNCLHEINAIFQTSGLTKPEFDKQLKEFMEELKAA